MDPFWIPPGLWEVGPVHKIGSFYNLGSNMGSHRVLIVNVNLRYILAVYDTTLQVSVSWGSRFGFLCKGSIACGSILRAPEFVETPNSRSQD